MNNTTPFYDAIYFENLGYIVINKIIKFKVSANGKVRIVLVNGECFTTNKKSESSEFLKFFGLKMEKLNNGSFILIRI